jgi:hypothetical protein
VNNKRFSELIKKKMISLLKAESKVELNQIFSDIEKSDEDGVKGILLNIFFFFLKKNLIFNLLFLIRLD